MAIPNPVCRNCEAVSSISANFCWMCGQAMRSEAKDLQKSEVSKLRREVSMNAKYIASLEKENRQLREDIEPLRAGRNQALDHTLNVVQAKKAEIAGLERELARARSTPAQPKSGCVQTCGILLAILGVGAIIGYAFAYMSGAR